MEGREGERVIEEEGEGGGKREGEGRGGRNWAREGVERKMERWENMGKKKGGELIR